MNIANLQNVPATHNTNRTRLATLLRTAHHAPQLSVTQERLWLLDQFRPGNSVYNFQTAWRVDGILDPSALNQAMDHVIQRHATLRSRFPANNGKPKVEIEDVYHNPVRHNNWGNRSYNDAEKDVQSLATKLAQTQFTLAKLPLFYVDLISLKDTSVVILTMHHLVSDLVSLTIFIRELAQYYTGITANNSIEVPPLTWNYQDFARYQRLTLANLKQHSSAEFWRTELANVQPLNWNCDWPQKDISDNRAATAHLHIDADLVSKVKELAKCQQVTPFVVLLSCFFVLQWRYSGQPDQWLGVPMAHRDRAELSSLIGMFSTPVPVRAQLHAGLSFIDLLQQIRHRLLASTENAELPLTEILRLATSENGQAPALSSLFSFLGHSESPDFAGHNADRLVTDRGISDFDLFLTLVQQGDQWRGILEYKLALFSEATGFQLAQHYQALLNKVTDNAMRTLGELTTDVTPPKKLRIAVAASFTADDIEAPLQALSKQLAWPLQVELAPYNQVFQTLLAGDGVINNQQDLNLLLVRPEDWVRYLPKDQDVKATLQNTIQDFCDILLQVSQRTSIHLVITPASPNTSVSENNLFAEARQWLREALASISGITWFDGEELLSPFHIPNAFDPSADKAGHIPYSAGWFACMASSAMRLTLNQVRPPVKVIALDCDNTLWQGILGEDGQSGIKITPPFQALQSHMKALAQSGVLLCLVSKNESSDVLSVFKNHPDMLLTLDDIVDHQINWQPKSQNLRELAKRLNLGLDSFVFLDDNPVEIAEVQAGCPQVLSLCLPETDKISEWLGNLWFINTGPQSADDIKRAQSYRDNAQREKLREHSHSMADFLSQLALEIDIRPAEDLTRIAQLHLRTNQFNNGGERLDERQLQQAISEGSQVWQISVRDRFGDYGLVGSMTTHHHEENLTIENFLLSCRVLGRGVEHRMLAKVGQIATEQHIEHISIHFKELPRNQPFQRFLKKESGATLLPQGYIVSAEQAQCCQAATNVEVDVQTTNQTPLESQQLITQFAKRQLALADSLAAPTDADQLVQWLLSSQKRHKRTAEVEQKPRGELETTLAKYWSEFLLIDELDRHDNFFEIGGTSLLLVQINGRLNQLLEREIPVTDLFQFPTIASLAEHLQQENKQPQKIAQAAGRASNARQQMAKRMQHLANQRPTGRKSKHPTL